MLKPSLQFELLVVVALVIILTFSVFYYLNINNQRNVFYDSFRDSAISLAQALDSSIGSRAELEETAKLQSNIYKMLWLNSNIVGISISLPVENGLRIVASNDTARVGGTALAENIASYQKGTIYTKVSTELDGTDVLRVVTPVHVGGQRVGVYDIKLSLDSLEDIVAKTRKEFLLITLASILVVIGILSLLINITVVGPVKQLLEGMERIGGGALDFRVRTRRQDELGNLFSSLNSMAEKLKERTESLREEREGLAEKVAQKTRELQEKINDLEEFNKLTVGRELKMVELKEEIQKLKGEDAQQGNSEQNS